MPLRRAPRELFVPQNAKAKNVYQRIALETFIEINFAADGRDADAVAVMRDAGNDSGKKAAVRCDLDVFDFSLCLVAPTRSPLHFQ